jgi:hypothetical protein
MSSLRNTFATWRFTAILGAVAILGTAGIYTWATGTVADPKSTASVPTERTVTRGEIASALKSNQPKDSALGSVLSDMSLFAWNNDLDWLSRRSVPLQASTEKPKLFWEDERPDLPVPAPSMSQPDTTTRQAAVQPPAVEYQAPAEQPRRVARETRPETVHAAKPTPQAAQPHRLAARPSYMEKIIEQGDAGEVTFRYRRQICAPPHMVDVCYMPQGNRRSIVVERW